jgi:hypothetical protein
MPEVDGKKYDYDEKGIKDAAIASAPKEPTDADVVEALGIVTDEPPQDPFDLESSKQTLKNATPEQKDQARKSLNIPDGMNMGGMTRDELGYMGGGMSYSKRGPVKYAKGGAVRGKTFRGSY